MMRCMLKQHVRVHALLVPTKLITLHRAQSRSDFHISLFEHTAAAPFCLKSHNFTSICEE